MYCYLEGEVLSRLIVKIDLEISIKVLLKVMVEPAQCVPKLPFSNEKQYMLLGCSEDCKLFLPFEVPDKLKYSSWFAAC